MLKNTKGFFHDIHIKRAANDGYIVEIGCKTFIMPKEKVKEGCAELRQYLFDPLAYENEYAWPKTSTMKLPDMPAKRSENIELTPKNQMTRPVESVPPPINYR